MRVLMTGGGTAGHINPALAIAGIIKEREKDSVIEFVGTKKGLESKLVPEAGYNIHYIDVMGILRSLSPSNIKRVYKAYKAISESKKIIREFKPDVVIGTGGYVSWPLIKAAHALKVPCALHEANAIPGFAVKTLKSKADLIMVGFDSAKDALSGSKAKIEVTGLPVRREFRVKYDKAAEREKLGIPASSRYVVLSFGGSLGADKINSSVLDLMEGYIKTHHDVFLVHATGRRSYDDFMIEAEKRGIDNLHNVEILPYIGNMANRIASSDLVICRSGASTLAELASLGAPSILIPSPNVTNDQQTKNARMFENAGAAVLISEDGLKNSNLSECIDGLLRSRLCEGMPEALKKFDHPDCDDLIYSHIKEIIK